MKTFTPKEVYEISQQILMNTDSAGADKDSLYILQTGFLSLFYELVLVSGEDNETTTV